MLKCFLSLQILTPRANPEWTETEESVAAAEAEESAQNNNDDAAEKKEAVNGVGANLPSWSLLFDMHLWGHMSVLLSYTQIAAYFWSFICSIIIMTMHITAVL